MASQLTDAFARKFYYLRLSITDVCNFRCTYCCRWLQAGQRHNNGFLSVDEVRRVTRAFSELGTEKVRLTGESPPCVVISLTLLPPCVKRTYPPDRGDHQRLPHGA